jgi:hypothetical protein
MEYIEFDIKQLIYELTNANIVPYSVELNCEIPGTTLQRIYGTCVYHGDEKDGMVEVVADFNCKVEFRNEEIFERGSFNGLFNLDQKCFVEGSCEVRL